MEANQTTSGQGGPISPASRLPWCALLALSGVGMAVSVLLARLHYRVHTDPSFQSFCAMGDVLNCDTVAQSRYSVFLGLPVAVWGLVGYALSGGVAAWGLRGRQAALPVGSCVLVGVAYTLVSAALVLVSTLEVHALCVLCMASYGVNLLILVVAVLLGRRVGLRAALAAPVDVGRRCPVRALCAAAAVGLGILALHQLYPRYWEGKSAAAAVTARPTVARASAPVAAPARGTDSDGIPWIGAEHARLVVAEFSDYECPFCRLAHARLRALVESHPDAVRLQHHHFPLDQACNRSLLAPFHLNACRAAAVAICAGRQGRFWEANDYLYEHARAVAKMPVAALAAELRLDAGALARCLEDAGPAALAREVEVGIKLGISATPTFVVDGQKHVGRLPAEVLRRLQGHGDDGGAGAHAAPRGGAGEPHRRERRAADAR